MDRRPPFVLGVAGGTASGKSTLTRLLADVLDKRGVLIVHDRYYHNLPDHLRSTPTLHNYDHPDALDTPRLLRDLDRLRAGESTAIPDYDFAHHKRGDGEEIIEARPVIVVEGILVLAEPELRSRFDKMVYVHTPDDVRLMRRIRRDVALRGRSVWEILDQYERTVRPMHLKYVDPSKAHAHLVLDGTLEPEGNLAKMLSLLPGG